MTATVCITTENLSKRYRKAEEQSLSQLGISVYEGEKFGVLGPNGAGKTTLISILCGIIAQTEGSYSYYEKGKALKTNEIKARIGYVPQDFAFYEELTPLQNMLYFGSFYKLEKEEILERTTEIFQALGLNKLRDKKIKIFSGGMKRRVNLAIGIVHKPTVLFLDEPTVGADVKSRFAMIEYLKKLNKQGTTIIYTSHHMAEAQDFCDRIAFIDKGKLLACDSLLNLNKTHHTKDLESLFINLSSNDDFEPYA